MLGEAHVRLGVHQRGAGLVAIVVFAEANHDALVVAIDAAVANILVTQQGANIGGGGVKPLGQSALQIDLQQEVHTAAQIEAQVHGQCVNGGQPLWRGRQQIEGDDVLAVIRVRVEGVLQNVARFQLGVGIRQADLDAVGIEKRTVAGQVVLVQNAGDLLQQFVV